METPSQIDLSKLKGILSGAKKLINKVETGDYTTGHIDGRALTDNGVQEMYAEGYHRPTQTQTHMNEQQENYTADQVRNSNLPAAIKEAMINNPIPKINVNPFAPQSFSLDDVAELQEKPVGYPQSRKPAPKQAPRQQQRLNEQAYYPQDTISVTKEQLKEMVDELVNEKLIGYFMKMSAERITENAVKKTLNALVKEGKLTAKKKTI
jgi:polyhydroxyalkanoate synthesis regulator phasin